MKIDPKMLVAPAIALVVLIVTLSQTLGALRSSGSWRTRARGPRVMATDPYARLDYLLAQRPTDEIPKDVRNPFRYFSVAPPVAVRPADRRRPVLVVPEKPILTAIVWDNDPRATIHFDGRDFSVRENSIFADFRVRSISNAQVVLERNGSPLVLTLRSKGD